MLHMANGTGASSLLIIVGTAQSVGLARALCFKQEAPWVQMPTRVYNSCLDFLTKLASSSLADF